MSSPRELGKDQSTFVRAFTKQLLDALLVKDKKKILQAFENCLPYSHYLAFAGSDLVTPAGQVLVSCTDKDLRVAVETVYSLAVMTTSTGDSAKAATCFQQLLDGAKQANDLTLRTSILHALSGLLYTTEVPHASMEASVSYLADQLTKSDAARKGAKKKFTQSQASYDTERDDGGKYTTSILEVLRHYPATLLKPLVPALTSIFQSHVYKMCDVIVMKHSLELLCRIPEVSQALESCLPTDHKSLQLAPPKKKDTKESRNKGEVPIIPTWEPLTAGQLARLCANNVRISRGSSSTSSNKFVTCLMYLLHHPNHYVFQEVMYSVLQNNLFDTFALSQDMVYKSSDTVLEYALNRCEAGFASTMQLELFSSLRLGYTLLIHSCKAAHVSPGGGIRCKALLGQTFTHAARNILESSRAEDPNLVCLSLSVMFAAQACRLLLLPEDAPESDILEIHQTIQIITTKSLSVCSVWKDRTTMTLFDNFLKISKLCAGNPKVVDELVLVATKVLEGLCTAPTEALRTDMWCAWLYATLRSLAVDVESGATPRRTLRLLVTLIGFTSNACYTRQWKETVLRFVCQFALRLFSTITREDEAQEVEELIASTYMTIVTSSQALLHVGIDTLVVIALFSKSVPLRMSVYQSLSLLMQRPEAAGQYITNALKAMDDIMSLVMEKRQGGNPTHITSKGLELKGKLIRQYNTDDDTAFEII
eukprot:PhF_6_TR29436/c0_g1_i3/m.43583